MHLRKQRLRHAEQPAQLGIPAQLVDVEQQGPAGVGDVRGVDGAAGQPPQEKTVDGPERQLAALGALAGARHIVEHPGDFGRGEIGVEEKSGPRADQRLGAVGLELGTAAGGAPVLPHDCAVDRFAGRAVPDHRCLALVADSDARDPARVDRAPRNCLARHGERVAPDVLRIVLDPAGARIILLELALGQRDRPRQLIEQDRPGRSRSLVDRQNMIRPGHAPLIGCGAVGRKGFSSRGPLLIRLG